MNIDIIQIVDIVRDANDLIMEIYNSDNFEVELKSDNSPLTKADRVSSDFICRSLKQITPDIPILCEEIEESHDYKIRKEWKTFWCVDPVDGTKEFLARNGEFTVLVGLVHNGEPILGVVGVPAQNTIYWAKKGCGSWKQIGNDNAIQIKCKSFSKTNEITAIGSRSHNNGEMEKLKSNWNIVKTISSGSALKFCLLADNKAHIYPRFHPCMEWDTCAPHIILREAGGEIYQINEYLYPTVSLEYNKKSLLTPNFIAIGHLV